RRADRNADAGRPQHETRSLARLLQRLRPTLAGDPTEARPVGPLAAKPKLLQRHQRNAQSSHRRPRAGVFTRAFGRCEADGESGGVTSQASVAIGGALPRHFRTSWESDIDLARK